MCTFSLLSEAKDFNALEEAIGRLVTRKVMDLTRAYLVNLDKKLMKERPSHLRLKGFRERSVATRYGDLLLERRVYFDQETGKYRYLLDEALKLPQRQRFSEGYRADAVDLSSRHSFRESARLLGGRASHTAIHAWGRRAGEAWLKALRAARREVFEQGKFRAVGRKVAALFCEADGVILRLQREARKVAEAKLAIVHEGWRKLHPAGGEYGLEGKLVYAALEGPRRFWESLCVLVAQRWDIEDMKVVAGDGAAWVKTGLDYFPGAIYQLCRFHIARKIRECLGWSKKILGRVMASRGDPEALLYESGMAVLEAPGPDEERQARELVQYLAKNEDGLSDYRCRVNIEGLELRGLGAIESNIDKTISNRMCKRGMAWSLRGAASMLALLTLRVNDRLEPVCDAVYGKRREVVFRRQRTWRHSGPEPGLRPVHMPILDSGRRQLTRVLRALSETQRPF